MSIFMKLAEKAVVKAGIGTLRASSVRRTKLPGHVVVRMRGFAKRRVLVSFVRGGKHAMVYGDVGEVPDSMPMFAEPLRAPATKRNYRCVMVRDVRA